MTILVDTSVLIDHLRGNAAAGRALSAASSRGERLACSVMTKVEILAGMRSTDEAVTRHLLNTLDWIGVNDEIAERAGLLANHYLRSHPGVDSVDYVIAATCQVREVTLWTRNLKHFPMFPDLKSPY